MMTKIPVRPLTGAGTPERTDIHKTTSLPKAEADVVRPLTGAGTPERTDKRKRATRLLLRLTAYRNDKVVKLSVCPKYVRTPNRTDTW